MGRRMRALDQRRRVRGHLLVVLMCLVTGVLCLKALSYPPGSLPVEWVVGVVLLVGAVLLMERVESVARRKVRR